MSEFLFIVSNLGITAGYVFLAVMVVPRATIRMTRTRIGGIGFFLLCGLHHLENVFHLVLAPDAKVIDVFTDLHMLLIDVPQAICVWSFVTGLYLEMTRWGPWSAGAAEPKE